MDKHTRLILWAVSGVILLTCMITVFVEASRKQVIEPIKPATEDARPMVGAGYDFFDTTRYPNLQPVTGDLLLFAHNSAAHTCTMDQILASGLPLGTVTSGTWNGTVIGTAYGGTGGATVAAARTNLGVSIARMTGDVPESAASLTALTDLSQTVVSGTNYVGTLVIKCIDSTAAEGVQFDFNGGSASASYFWAGASIPTSGGTDVTGTNIATALNGVMNFTTFTGESVVVINVSITASSNGTIIPRAAQNTHATGTATFRKGSWFELEPTAN